MLMVKIAWNWIFSFISRVWQYGLWSFQTRGIKLARFLPKNQPTQRKLLNFWFGLMRRCQKVKNYTTSWHSKSIFYIKNYPNLSQFFFSLKNINLGAHFLLLTFCDNINFWQLATTPIIKILWFPLCMLIFSQRPLEFCIPSWKLHNLYCHNIYVSTKFCVYNGGHQKMEFPHKYSKESLYISVS